jgi:hypothetical protein
MIAQLSALTALSLLVAHNNAATNSITNISALQLTIFNANTANTCDTNDVMTVLNSDNAKLPLDGQCRIDNQSTDLLDASSTSAAQSGTLICTQDANGALQLDVKVFDNAKADCTSSKPYMTITASQASGQSL